MSGLMRKDRDRIQACTAMMAGLFAVLVMLAGPTEKAYAQGPLVADISADEVAITIDFNGASLLLFGAMDGAKDDDIIIAIKGPDTKVVTRRKGRTSGIWINQDEVVWSRAPSYYQLFTNREIEAITDDAARNTLKIGDIPASLLVSDGSKAELARDIDAWRRALTRNMQEAGLWGLNEGQVEVIRGALFRANVSLPANIVPGEYEVRILHLADGKFIAEEKTTLSVAKSGIGALIYQTAHDHSVFYGLFAIAFAVFAGWLAAIAFRR